MRTPSANWSEWSRFLRRWGLQGLTAWFMEAGGPLTVLGAQALYLSQPFWNSDRIESLAHMLEDYEETRAFTAFLREETST